MTDTTRRIQALDIPEERTLAGRLAGLLYITAAISILGLILVPGVDHRHWKVVVVIAAVAAVWSVICFAVIDWENVSPYVSHLSSSLGLVLTATAMAATGGASSPARFFVIFVVLYTAYFYPWRETVSYVVACILVLTSPALYDTGAEEAGLAGELIVMTPIYAAVAWTVVSAKRLSLRLRREAVHLSLSDSLTGLANRRALIERLEASVGPARRSGDAVGLLLVDLDGFKNANTLYGHPGGDQVLRETARSLAAAARGDDFVARLGGDEFAIVATRVDGDGMATLSERVLAAMRETDARLELPGFRVSASLGWAIHPLHAETVDELIVAADLALRGAKLGGKDQSLGPVRGR